MNQPKPKPDPIHIPHTPLAAKITEATEIKRAMTALLRDLESKTNTPPTWRHHPPASVAPEIPPHDSAQA